MSRLNLERSNIEQFLSGDCSQLTANQIKYLHAKLRVEVLKDSIEDYEELLRNQITKLIVAHYQLTIAELDLEGKNVSNTP